MTATSTPREATKPTAAPVVHTERRLLILTPALMRIWYATWLGGGAAPHLRQLQLSLQQIMAATDFGVLSLPWRLSPMSCWSSIRYDRIHQPARPCIIALSKGPFGARRPANMSASAASILLAYGTASVHMAATMSAAMTANHH